MRCKKCGAEIGEERVCPFCDTPIKNVLMHEALLKENPDHLENVTLKLIIINNKEAMDTINKDRKLLEKYKTLNVRYRNLKREFAKPLTKNEGLFYKDGVFKEYKLLV